MADATHPTGKIERDQRLFNDLSWWEKYHHQLLEATSFALGTAAMIVPGTGWVIGGLLMGCFTAGAADVTLYAMEGDTPDAIISGVFLLPLAIGGTIKLVQLSRSKPGPPKSVERQICLYGTMTQISSAQISNLQRT